MARQIDPVIVASVTDRLLSELRSARPPQTVKDLANRLGAPKSTVAWVIKREITAGTLTESMLPWGRRSEHARVSERQTSAVAQYREENNRLRAENAKLLAAHGLSAKSQEEALAPHLQQIFRAAGRELCERVFQAVWPPSAILTAQEASHEAEAVAASPPS